jgi:hypothetical protein
LHQPFGLITPVTTLHDVGLIRNVQAAQLNRPFGKF